MTTLIAMEEQLSTAIPHHDASLRLATYVQVKDLAAPHHIDLNLLEHVVEKTKEARHHADSSSDVSKTYNTEEATPGNVSSHSSTFESKSSKDHMSPGQSQLLFKGGNSANINKTFAQHKQHPPYGGFNLCLLVGRIDVVVDKLRVDGSRVRLAEVLVGDETGSMSLRARDNQIDLLQEISHKSGAVVLRNCTVELYQGRHLRLAVTKWGNLCSYPDNIKSTPSPPTKINVEMNLSEADLNLMREAVNESAAHQIQLGRHLDHGHQPPRTDYVNYETLPSIEYSNSYHNKWKNQTLQSPGNSSTKYSPKEQLHIDHIGKPNANVVYDPTSNMFFYPHPGGHPYYPNQYEMGAQRGGKSQSQRRKRNQKQQQLLQQQHLMQMQSIYYQEHERRRMFLQHQHHTHSSPVIISDMMQSMNIEGGTPAVVPGVANHSTGTQHQSPSRTNSSTVGPTCNPRLTNNHFFVPMETTTSQPSQHSGQRPQYHQQHQGIAHNSNIMYPSTFDNSAQIMEPSSPKTSPCHENQLQSAIPVSLQPNTYNKPHETVVQKSQDFQPDLSVATSPPSSPSTSSGVLLSHPTHHQVQAGQYAAYYPYPPPHGSQIYTSPHMYGQNLLYVPSMNASHGPPHTTLPTDGTSEGTAVALNDPSTKPSTAIGSEQPGPPISMSYAQKAASNSNSLSGVNRTTSKNNKTAKGIGSRSENEKETK